MLRYRNLPLKEWNVKYNEMLLSRRLLSAAQHVGVGGSSGSASSASTASAAAAVNSLASSSSRSVGLMTQHVPALAKKRTE